MKFSHDKASFKLSNDVVIQDNASTVFPMVMNPRNTGTHQNWSTDSPYARLNCRKIKQNEDAAYISIYKKEKYPPIAQQSNTFWKFQLQVNHTTNMAATLVQTHLQ